VPIHADTKDDLTLLQHAARGDEAAFERLMSRHEGAVHRFIRTLTPDTTSAEDALQETFLAAWRGASGFRGEASVRSWLFTIARHAAYRQGRRHVGEPGPDDQTPLDELGVQAGWGQDDPERATARREEHDAIERALAALMPEDRRVLVLRDLEQLSGEETAAILGLTLPALKSRLHRARLRFAARFRQETTDGH
jgi:RNA polymerase sigma-70 factor (ECF subfamily)